VLAHNTGKVFCTRINNTVGMSEHDTSRDFFTGQLLLAMPSLLDPNFSHTVTYLCEHHVHGAMGVVVNRPLELSVADILEHLEIEAEDPELKGRRVFYGGPVQPERGFVLHSVEGEWESSFVIQDGFQLTTSRDILQAIARGAGPSRWLITLGYAGWGGGQLEHEVGENAWLNAPASPALVFDLPAEQRWAAAARALGIDIRLLSGMAGHA